MLKNKNCIIIGASGEIGISCANLFYLNGANLILIYNKNKKVIKDFKKNKKNIFSFKCDLSKEKEIKKTYKKINRIFSEINVLINCAGIMKAQNYFMDEKLSNLKTHININTIGTIFFTKLLARDMIKSKNPSIVNVSSITANLGIPSFSNYSTSKGALKSFTISSARELGPLGVRVNLISPGIIKTKIHKNINIDKFKKNISLERLGKPSDVAGVILFLASDYSSYINGQDIQVDGQIKTF